MGKKKDAALHGMSKKERAALEARAAELAAEIARREAKAKRKAKAAKPPKKSKRLKAAILDAVREHPVEAIEITAEPEAPIEPTPEIAAAVEVAKANGAPLSSDEMRATLDAEIKARLAAKRAERDARLDETPTKIAKARAERHAPKLEKATKRPEDGVGLVGTVGHEDVVTALAEPHVAEIVETDHGREFAVGVDPATGEVTTEDEFAKPSEAPRLDFEVNGNGQYKVQRPSDGKIVGYTRVTTYIACLEDTTALEKWKARIILEGVAAAEDDVVDRVAKLAYTRDAAIAKARKADKKGKLDVGELATYVNGAWGDFKKALDALADEVFEIGGGREKATKGTDIHALCDLAERDGIAAVGDLLTEGKITPSDLHDVEAYLDAVRRLGARPVLAEQVIVNDDLKVAGRLDRVYMVKLPGELRARKRVVDLKTGRVDYGTGKIAQQIEMYAGGVAYDLNTHERTPLGVDRTLGLLIHLPAGTGKATVHRVDLSLGRKGNRLAGEVRAWRNEGKRAIDLKADVLAEIEKGTDLHV